MTPTRLAESMYAGFPLLSPRLRAARRPLPGQHLNEICLMMVVLRNSMEEVNQPAAYHPYNG